MKARKVPSKVASTVAMTYISRVSGLSRAGVVSTPPPSLGGNGEAPMSEANRWVRSAHRVERSTRNWAAATTTTNTPAARVEAPRRRLCRSMWG